MFESLSPKEKIKGPANHISISYYITFDLKLDSPLAVFLGF